MRQNEKRKGRQVCFKEGTATKKVKEKAPDLFAKTQTAETRAHVVSDDCAWHAVMKLAEQHGFILQAAGGTAF